MPFLNSLGRVVFSVPCSDVNKLMFLNDGIPSNGIEKRIQHDSLVLKPEICPAEVM